MAIFALVDGNSFYASCQAAFDPSLRHRPVVVLSNNDGCVVAANGRAKQIDAMLKQQAKTFGKGGYKAAKPNSIMYQPFFKVRPYLEQFNTAVFSSNYELYADMSSRMHSLLGQMAWRQEIYSIDESFLELTGMPPQQLSQHGWQIKQRIDQCLGLPVAVGIAPSRTLAKLANHLAKKHTQYQGVLELVSLSESNLNHLLKHVSVENVWGVGRKLSKKLMSQGILTAYDLKKQDLRWVRKRYSITVERLVRELRGQDCLGVDEVDSENRQIISSRSFGQAVTTLQAMEQAVATYVGRAAQKMRAQHKECLYVTVYIRTNRFDKKSEVYQPAETVPLIYPSDHTVLLVKLAKRALHHIWQEGLAYHKAGVVLSGVRPKQAFQLDCLAPQPCFTGNERGQQLMTTMDRLNASMGNGTLHLAAEGVQMAKRQSWRMRREAMSNRYTTHWDELLQVH